MAPVFRCSRCSVLFKNQRNLNRHQCDHNTTFLFSCEYCAYTTTRKDNLKRHSDKYHRSNNSSPENKSATLPVSVDQYQLLNKSNNSFPIVAQSSSPTSVEEVLNENTLMDFDKRLQLPHNFIYAGATQSGKTTLLLKTLENATTLYEPPPSRIYFLHNCFQQNYEKLKEKLYKQGIQIEFIKKPTVSETDLENMSDQNGGQTLIIIDDNSISAASSKEVAQVFTIARHKNCSIVLLLHFIFGPWPTSRIISANTSYFFLLKSPRMAQQISTLGLQLGKQNELVSAYAQASRKPYGYVLLDLCTNTPDNFRIQTDIHVVEEEQQNELSQVDSVMLKYGLKTADVPLKVKASKTVTPQLEKEPLWCSDHVKNIMTERTTHKQKKKQPRNVSTMNFVNNTTVPFANRYRRYI